MTLFQKRVSYSSFDRARTVTYTRPTFGKRCSNMLNVTLPRKPVPPIRKIFRPLKISVGESLAVMIQVCLPLRGLVNQLCNYLSNGEGVQCSSLARFAP